MRPNSTMLFGCISVSMRQPRANLSRSPAPVPFPAASVSAAHSPNTETEVNMAIINLRDFYPYYTMDSFIEVPDEVAEAMAEFDRKEAAYRLRTYQHKAYYSLDREDGIEHSALFVALFPCEIYERNEMVYRKGASGQAGPKRGERRRGSALCRALPFRVSPQDKRETEGFNPDSERRPRWYNL